MGIHAKVTGRVAHTISLHWFRHSLPHRALKSGLAPTPNASAMGLFAAVTGEVSPGPTTLCIETLAQEAWNGD